MKSKEFSHQFLVTLKDVKNLDGFNEQEEYAKHMSAIDWPAVLLQPRRERDRFEPEAEDRKVMVMPA